MKSSTSRLAASCVPYTSEHENALRSCPADARSCAGAGAQSAPQSLDIGSDFLAPFPAHHVIGNIYFVGSKNLGIYLVTTPQGHILINTGLEDSVPMIQQSVEKLGFRFSDIKILLISHAHYDHDAGAARIEQSTGAQYMVMDADVPVVESGGEKDFFYNHTPGMLYPATRVDRVLHNGDTVTLGDSVITAHLTPGHTKGWGTQTRSSIRRATKNLSSTGNRLFKRN
jgi:metallo-beta-lactamase class B